MNDNRGHGGAHEDLGAGNALVLQRAPMRDKLAAAGLAWQRLGRGLQGLLTGRAYFAAKCWAMGTHQDPGWCDHPDLVTALMKASDIAAGGAQGWLAVLRERASCGTCAMSYRLENIRICAFCTRYVCARCTRAHAECDDQVVG